MERPIAAWLRVAQFKRAIKGKLLAFDLETSNLAANRGHIICAAAKWVGQKEVKTWRIDDAPDFGRGEIGTRAWSASLMNDKHIVEGLIPLLEEADAVLAYYGTGFDVPYINTRAIVSKLAPPVPFTVIDPWQTASRHLKLARNDMGSVATLVGAKHAKFHLPWESWRYAQYGSRQDISTLLKYNINDVLALEDVYFGVRPLMRNHPYLGDAVTAGATLRCPACGGSRGRPHDVRRTRTFEVFRSRCRDCGTAYETGRRKIK